MTLGGWGLSPWGTTSLRLLSATPIRENVVRLGFNLEIYFSRLLDPGDGSNRKRYVVTPVAGSVDDDGDPTRPVFPALIRAPGSGNTIDITFDRMMSSWPAKYSIAVNQLRSRGGAQLDLLRTSTTFDGVQYDETGGANRAAVTNADFANPQTTEGLAIGISPEQAAILGSYPMGPTGDYANDQGLGSYKKRIFRRLLARKGGYAALSVSYGLGAQDRIKKLMRGTDTTQLGDDATSQVLADPETKKASVTFTRVPGSPSIGYFTIVALHVSGQAINETMPVSIGG